MALVSGEEKVLDADSVTSTCCSVIGPEYYGIGLIGRIREFGHLGWEDNIGACKVLDEMAISGFHV
ncbi:hypothetical protein CCACVL1_08899 [Corchorus capsularis]|uniref:Uncharacterized protein n=1 Tax=Corchorus capsularis TaxID=210143 RepID=A0A1R3IYF7_COCAP|nr:hypothetical protein CCACVL1_08899 [Corchorus capsularis]